jgi:hypothetical protein
MSTRRSRARRGTAPAWKPPRQRAEVLKAVVGAGGTVLVTLLVVLGMHWLWDDDGGSGITPNVPLSSIPSTAPGSGSGSTTSTSAAPGATTTAPPGSSTTVTSAPAP